VRKNRIVFRPMLIIMQIPFVLYSLTIVIMCFILVMTPFRSSNDLARGILTRPQGFTFENFVGIWKAGLGNGVMNSFFLASMTCLFSVVIGALAGYAFTFFRFIGKTSLYLLIYSGIFISTMLIVLPLFLQYRDLHLVNNLVGTLLIFIGIRMPFSVYLFKSFFKEFSIELMDAAKMDGLTDLKILAWIIMPLSKGVIVTVLLFNFSAVWTDYLIGLLFLQKESLMTVMPLIMSIFGAGPMTTRATPLGQGFAGLLVSTAPLLIIYFFTKKNYIEGLTLGSVK